MADPIEKILRELDQPVEPRPEFGHRLLDQLLDSLGSTTSVAPPARPRFPFLRELVAAAALLVFAIGLAVAFSVLRSSRQPSTSPSPPPQRPSPAVILFSDAGNANQVDGMTWDGQSVTVTRVPNANPNPAGASSSNPAGTLFVDFPKIVDRSGRVVAELTGGPYADSSANIFFGTWADDELHYCQVVPFLARGTKPEVGTLQLMTPGGRPRDVARVGIQAPGANTLGVTVCSVLADRAVVIQREQTFIQYWVVQLSSGRVLWTHNRKSTCPPPVPTASACGITNVVASRDGRYIAEEIPTRTSFIYRPDGSKAEDILTGPSTIYGPDGSPVGNVDGSVRAFSWDGSLAVIYSNGGRASVIRWANGTVIWTAPLGKKIWGFQPEPGGTSLAVLTGDPAAGYGRPTSPLVLYLVSSDGRVIGQHEVGWSLLACLPIACGGAAW